MDGDSLEVITRLEYVGCFWWVFVSLPLVECGLAGYCMVWREKVGSGVAGCVFGWWGDGKRPDIGCVTRLAGYC